MELLGARRLSNANPVLSELLGRSPRSDQGATHVRPHVDEADDDVIRIDPESALHLIVVSGLAGPPQRAKTLGKGCQHDAVRGTAAGEDLLDDGNPRGAIESGCDH